MIAQAMNRAARLLGCGLLAGLAGWSLAPGIVAAEAPGRVGSIPEDVRRAFQLSPFYQKHIGVEGLPIVASDKVSDFALAEAAYLIRQMLGGRPDILQALATNRVRFAVMAVTEFTTDIPEHGDLQPKAYWDKRARGLGASRTRPAVSCGEENLLGCPGDPYATENILIHEFGHAIHQMGLSRVDPTFDRRLAAAYDAARKAGLWEGKYAGSNKNWLDAAGGRKSYGRLRPKETSTHSTFAGHLWLITDAQDRPLAVFEAGATTGRAFIAPAAK
jgi:hypothetical protein